MNFLIAPNSAKPEAITVASEIVKILKKKKAQIFAEEDMAKMLNLSSDFSPKNLDFIITCGGDGTILQFARKYVKTTKAPIVGVNLGRLGFLADIHFEQAEERLEQLVLGNYTVEKRLILNTVLPNGKSYLTINDTVIHRGMNRSLIELKVSINGRFLNTFKTDGYIVSTPTGATAYSLAAGGPLILPTQDVLALTPICPHTLSNRPLVTSGKDLLSIEYVSPFKPLDVTIDGIERYTLHSGDSITIKASSKYLQMVAFPDRDYFTILREKLHWKGSSHPQ